MIKKKKKFTKGKKILGMLFKLTAVVLACIFLIRLPQLVRTFNGIFKLASGETDSYQSGYISGLFIYWLLHIGLAVVFWLFGKRWGKNEREDR